MPQIGDTYRVLLYGQLFGVVETRNMFTYGLTSANATEDEVAGGLEDAIDTIFAARLASFSTQWHVYKTETQKWYPAAGGVPGYWLTYHSTARSRTGTDGADITGYQPAILLTFKTVVKKVIGRKFLAGLPEDGTLNGLINAANLTGFAAMIVSLLTPVTFGAGGSAELGVLNKNGVFVPFISGTVGNIISSMRRRKPGYGI